MAKSILKTKISELLEIDRESIKFVRELNRVSIKVDEYSMVGFELEETSFCCGVLECGNTTFNTASLMKLSENDRNSLIVDCFNQLYRMVKQLVESKEQKKGLLNWTHTDNNIIAIALRSEFNKEDMPWKFVQEFFNPNSNNTVNYFIANLN